MTEAYAVQSRLTMSSNVPEMVAQMVKGFETVNRIVKETQANVGRLAADLRLLADGNRGIGNLVRSFEKLSSMKMSGGMLTELREVATMTREMQTAQRDMARAAQQTATAYREMAAAGRRVQPTVTPRPSGGRGGGRTGGGGHVCVVDAAMGAGMAGDAGVGMLERSLNAELEVQKYLASFRMNTTINPSDMQEIRAKAEALVRSVPGTTVAENLHSMLDAFTVVGDLKEAMAGSESMAKLNLLLSSLPGAKGKDPGFAAAQAVEMMQRFYNPQTHAVDINALNQQIGAIGRVAAGTTDRMSPEAYLAFTKQARVASMTASDKFLYEDAPAAMIAMGGSRYGTGLAALFTQFQTGTMTKNAYLALQKSGLLDRSAKWKGGRVQDIGSHLRDSQLAGTNLVDFVRQDVLGPRGAMAQQGVDANDKIAVARWLSSFTGKQTGLGVLAETVLGMAGIDKEAAKMRATVQDPLATLQATDPNMKVKEFHAAENELMVAAGQALLGPAIEGMKALTGVLRDITDWAKAHPEGAKDMLLVAAGMTVLAKAAGDLALVIFVGAPLVGGMRALTGALTPFGASGSAAAALGTLTGATGLGALSVGVVGLGAAVIGTVAAIKGFSAINEALGLHAGKGEGPNAPASPSGNHFMDGLKGWWNGFISPQAPNSHPNARGNVGAHASPISYVTPPSGGGQMIQVHSELVIDGRRLARAVSDHIGKAMDGPNTGMTGADPRASFRGATVQWA